MKRPFFASGNKIGGVARHTWVCLICNAVFKEKPAKNTQCRGSAVKAHPTVAQHFSSRAEAKRYDELRLLERAGKISALGFQPVFRLEVNGITIGKYIADFSYVKNGTWVNEDVKGGAMTEISDLKRRLAEAIYGVKITIVQMK